MKKVSFLFFFLGIRFLASAQDSSFVKSYYGGSSLKVPENKTWTIEKAFISGGDGYNIKIAAGNFKLSYTGGETINFPYYIAEMELISDKSMMSYIVYITEKKETKK
jgi:hypothetical protein